MPATNATREQRVPFARGPPAAARPGFTDLPFQFDLPLADRAAIDVHEPRARIIADPAAAQAGGGGADLAQVAALGAHVDRHALDVIAVAGDAAAAHVHAVVGGRRAVAADHQERVVA